MKHTILSIASVLFSAVTFGQTFEFEITGRAALTSLRGNKLIEENYDPTFRMGYGVGGNLVFANSLLLNAALLIDRKGGYGESSVQMRDENGNTLESYPITLESSYSYLTLPVQLGKRFGEKIQFEATLGGYVSLLLSHRHIEKSSVFTLDTRGTLNEKDFDFGLVGGVNVYFPLSDNVFLKSGINNMYGLAHTNSHKVFENGSIKHNSLGLFAALNFRF